MDIDTSKYSGEAKHCCLMMDMALDYRYLYPTITFSGTRRYPPSIAGAPVNPETRSRSTKTYGDLLVNYCPWCGKKLTEDAPAASETEQL